MIRICMLGDRIRRIDIRYITFDPSDKHVRILIVYPVHAMQVFLA